LYIEIYTDN